MELDNIMKHTALILLLVASTVAATAQVPVKPAASGKPSAAKHVIRRTAAATATKLPAGVPPVKGIEKTLFTASLRYQEIKIGTGAVAEPGKIYKVFYTGWLGDNGRGDDGRKFDSTDDHPRPQLKDKDGKPLLGADGKPKFGPAQPIIFPQGYGRVIPGFDQGFTGMKVGGERRIFIPWELAYGAQGRPGPDAAHPGIPPKANLIFDIELVDVIDLPKPASRPVVHPTPAVHPKPAATVTAAKPATPSVSPAAATPATQAQPQSK
jgi:peptidylprolyl isomerase